MFGLRESKALGKIWGNKVKLTYSIWNRTNFEELEIFNFNNNDENRTSMAEKITKDWDVFVLFN